MREHEPRHPVGERRLADAGRPADQPGMRHAARAIGVEQRLLGLGVTDEFAGLARMWKLVLVVARVGSRHDATSSSATGAVAGSSRLLTTVQIWSATSMRVPLASISTQRFGSLMASMRKASRSFSWKSFELALEAVARGIAAALLGARQSDLDRRVEHEGEIGLEVADGDAFERPQQLRIDPAKLALIDAGRIREAVADHPAAARQRRRDGVADVVVARGREQDRLGGGPERLGRARQQHVPDDLGARRAAGLAREHDADPERAQLLRQQRRVAGLAGPLAAFKGDESSAHR